MITNYMGHDGFVWWIGVVEDRLDPLKIGRCRVRIVGAHTANKTIIPTSMLPWAQAMLPITGSSMFMIKDGDYVIGFYLDGNDAQHPVIMGILPGIPDEVVPRQFGFCDSRSDAQLANAPRPPGSLSTTSASRESIKITEAKTAFRNPTRLNEPTTSRLIRNDPATIGGTIISSKKALALKSIPVAGGGSFNEPPSAYGAQYPFNRVIESESGHVIEIDDTPKKERIHIYHRSGTSIEIGPDGVYVSRVNSKKYDITLSDHNIFVNGDCNITADKKINLKSGDDMNIEVGGALRIKAKKNIDIQAGKILELMGLMLCTVTGMFGLKLFAKGPVVMQGLVSLIQPAVPIPTKPILGPTFTPIDPMPDGERKQNAAATQSLLEKFIPRDVVEPNPKDPGSKELCQRPGIIYPKSCDSNSKPLATPAGLPLPTQPEIPEGDVIVKAMNRARIQDKDRRAMIWSQCHVESDGFKQTKEETALATRESLLRDWPAYFNEGNVDEYARDGGVKWPSRVYGNILGNGSEQSGEGYKYRGRGYIQLTGKAAYIAASKKFNQDFVNYPDVMTEPTLAADIAIWYFQEGGHGTGYNGDPSNVITVTNFVTNGGNIQLAQRANMFNEAKKKREVVEFKEVNTKFIA